MHEQYLWSDAWVLYAILLAGSSSPATLRAIIGAADAVNHAVLTYEEMDGALARLTAGGYVVDQGGRFAPSEAALALLHSVARPQRDLFRELEALRRLLGASQGSGSYKTANQCASYPGLTREAFDSAVDEYLRAFGKR